MTLMAYNSLLTVYKASAGSGKTFRLAVRYIAMLVANPRSYSHILAVTFTNKATAEMKRRILSQLYGIAHGLESSAPYYNEVRKIYPGMSEADIRYGASKALDNILQDYGHFRIETIDSFFQTVLRGLARELHQGAGMNVDLDVETAISEAVDSLFDNIDTNGADFRSLTRFIEGNIDNDRNWDARGSIKKFASELFHESFAEKVGQLKQVLAENGAIDRIRKKLSEQRDSELDVYRKTCTEAYSGICDILAENGFSVGSLHKNIKGVVAKMENAGLLDEKKLPVTFLKCCDDWRPFFLAADARQPGMDSWAGGLCDCVRLVKDAFEGYAYKSHSFDAALAYMHELELLMSVRRQIDDDSREQNRFLLADTAGLLSELTTGDTSFVFEKTGSFFRHIMIDEFQDTSRMQWNNLYLLLLECLSNNEDCLVVGDVKQSIYRWRNGDWNILNTGIQKKLAKYSPHIEPMQDNFRSLPSVVEFNNRLFPFAVECVQNMLEEKNGVRFPALDTAYADVSQNARESHMPGFVRASAFTLDKDEDPMLRIAALLDELTENGVHQSDIAILCRYGKEISMIAEWFAVNRPEYRMISAEAFRLEASVPVRILVNALRWTADRNDRIALATMLYDMQNSLSDSPMTMDGILASDMETLLPDGIAGQWDMLRGLSLYELVETLYLKLGLEGIEGQDQYVMAFFDNVASWLKQNSGNVSQFLEEWDGNIHKNAVPQEQMKGVSLLTIHKSKGLEYHTVIVPFCNWPLIDYRDKLWVEPKSAPFDTLPLIPVPFEQNLAVSVFSDDYLNEYGQQSVDNLNLLYVALTRAACNLVVMSPKPSRYVDTSVYSVMARCLEEGFGSGSALDGPVGYEQGCMTPHLEEKKKVSDNPFDAEPQSVDVHMHSWPMSARFRQSGDSMRFAFSLTDEDERRQSGFIERGKLLHSLFSSIRTLDDVGPQVERLLSDGLLDSPAQAESIKAYVLDHIEKSGVGNWFNGSGRLFTESAIVFRNGSAMQNRRPDRVMMYDDGSAVVVDFKFAQQREEYVHQVQEYMDLISRMGMDNVKGYLWHVDRNLVVEVKA